MPELPSQRSRPESFYMCEEASPILAMFTFATMGQGILITILGLGTCATAHSATFGFFLAGFGFTLLLTQYGSTYRRSLLCLAVASGQLALLSFVGLIFLLLGGFLVLLPLIISLTTLLLNLAWCASLLEQREFISHDASTHQLTLREILGAILILALILGPASFFFR